MMMTTMMMIWWYGDTHQLIWTAYLPKHCWGHVSSVMLNLETKPECWHRNPHLALPKTRRQNANSQLCAANQHRFRASFRGVEILIGCAKTINNFLLSPFVFVRSISLFNCDRQFFLTWHDTHSRTQVRINPCITIKGILKEYWSLVTTVPFHLFKILD